MMYLRSTIHTCIQTSAISRQTRFYSVFSGIGEVTEWLKVLAWNAGVVKATEGSNPSLTAIISWSFRDIKILTDGRVPVTVDP